MYTSTNEKRIVFDSALPYSTDGSQSLSRGKRSVWSKALRPCTPNSRKQQGYQTGWGLRAVIARSGLVGQSDRWQQANLVSRRETLQIAIWIVKHKVTWRDWELRAVIARSGLVGQSDRWQQANLISRWKTMYLTARISFRREVAVPNFKVQTNPTS